VFSLTWLFSVQGRWNQPHWELVSTLSLLHQKEMQRGQNLLQKMRLLCQSLKQFWNLRYKSCHDLAYLRNERTERVLGVGSVLLQLLDAQQQLNELPNLNGDLLGDLLDGRVVYCFNDGDAEISAMFAFVSGAGSEVVDRLLKFKSEHLCSGPLLRMAIRVRLDSP
jgi:hypothetical protein